MKNLLTFTLILSLWLITSCSEKENFEYPIVHTGEIVIQNGTITFNGAVYNKDHLNPGTLEYGFLTKKISEDERKSIKAQSLSGKFNFSTTLPLDSVPGDGYVKAYIKTKEGKFYGKFREYTNDNY